MGIWRMKGKGAAINKDLFCCVALNSLHFATDASYIHLLSKNLLPKMKRFCEGRFGFETLYRADFSMCLPLFLFLNKIELFYT
jgi:hypothetical protein